MGSVAGMSTRSFLLVSGEICLEIGWCLAIGRDAVAGQLVSVSDFYFGGRRTSEHTLRFLL